MRYSDAAGTNHAPHQPHASAYLASDLDVDVQRIVWDPDYRHEVMAELRRRRALAELSHNTGFTPSRPYGRGS